MERAELRNDQFEREIEKTFAGSFSICDGTLADTMPSHYEAWIVDPRSVRLEMSEDRFYALGGWPTQRWPIC